MMHKPVKCAMHACALHMYNMSFFSMCEINQSDISLDCQMRAIFSKNSIRRPTMMYIWERTTEILTCKNIK